MYLCKTCGWLFSSQYCPRCGTSAFTDNNLSDVTISSYDEDDVSSDVTLLPSSAWRGKEATAREMLWGAMHEPVPDPNLCLELADTLRTYAPEDYYANFVDVVFSGGEDYMERFLSQPRAPGAEMYAETVLDYVCSHMSTKLCPIVKRYLERTDLADPAKYETLIKSYLPDRVRKETEDAEDCDRKEEERIRREAEYERQKEEEALSHVLYSRGFEFRKRDGRYVLMWVGECEDAELVIPPFYNGMPVAGIGDKAFTGCERIKSVVIPSGMTFVGAEAFAGCVSLKSVKFPETLESIGDYAFAGCKSLCDVSLPESLKSVREGLFRVCSRLDCLVIPPEVTRIEARAFEFCESLSAVYISVGVEKIGSEAFGHCADSLKIYYLGTEDWWDRIDKEVDYRGRPPLFGGRRIGGRADHAIYFYSESNPGNPGHFWHYDENGNTAEW